MSAIAETSSPSQPDAVPPATVPAGQIDHSRQTSPPPQGVSHQTETHVQELVAAPNGRRFWTVLGFMALVIVIAGGATSVLMNDSEQQSTNDAYVEGRVVRISPKVSGQVLALHVDDNVAVKAGDVLLEIDPADYQARLDQAAAAVAAAESAVEQAKTVVLRAQAGVGEAEAAARAATTEAKRRASDYRRYAAMGTDGISAQQLETAQAAADAGEDQREAAIKKVDAAEAELNVARANVGAAQSQAAAARAQLHFAQLQLQYTKVIAPESGRVTNKNVEPGAFVSTGQPLLALVPEDKWIVANLKEVQLSRIRVGQAVTVRVDSFPNLKFQARVQSLQAGTGSRFQLLPPENATGNWVKVVQRLPVKIVFDPGQRALPQLAPGMSADVTVDTRRSEVQP